MNGYIEIGFDPVVADTNSHYAKLDIADREYNALRKQADDAEGDFIAEAMQDHMDSIVYELIDQTDDAGMVRLAIMGAFENAADYLGPNYDESQGADDGTEFRFQFLRALDLVVDHLKEKWIEREREV